MSLSTSIFGTRLMVAPPSLGVKKPTVGELLIVCSSRPQKKATAHHMKTRPRKSQPWDINRKPTEYPPLPPLPPDWTLVISADESAAAAPPVPTSPSA